MSIITLASVTGAPGVSTTGLGVALAWPGDVVLIDADRDGGQAGLAGYFRGISAESCGLVELAKVYRAGESVEGSLLRHSLALRSTTEHRRHFLPGFTKPATVLMFTPLWHEFARAFRALSDTGMDVVIDAGRLGAEGLPPALLECSDVLAVHCRSTLRSLAALTPALATVTDLCEDADTDVGLVVVGPDRPYSCKEIEQQFGIPVLAGLPFDAKAAETLSEGSARPRRQSPQLGRAYEALASRWQTRRLDRELSLEGLA